jgi:Raf kinase inhibitor-like YbhB/YbcL family protein
MPSKVTAGTPAKCAQETTALTKAKRHLTLAKSAISKLKNTIRKAQKSKSRNKQDQLAKLQSQLQGLQTALARANTDAQDAQAKLLACKTGKPIPTATATPAPTATPLPTAPATPMSTPTPTDQFTLGSPAFLDGQPIAPTYNNIGDCGGSNTSVPLYWKNVPANTSAFALILVDTDAFFIHWNLFNIPGSTTSLPAGIPHQSTLPDGSKQTVNEFFFDPVVNAVQIQIGYGGPCPPSGMVHHYQFTLYALNAPIQSSDINLNDETSLSNYLSLDSPHHDMIIARTTLVGTVIRAQ